MMQYRLEMPFVNKQVVRGTISRWLVEEGESVNFGDDLCDVTIAEIEHLDRPGRTRWHFSRQRKEADVHTSKRVRFDVRVTASEPGIVQTIRTTEGATVGVGDLLAVMATTPTFPGDDAPLSDLPVFRVAVNPLDPLD